MPYREPSYQNGSIHRWSTSRYCLTTFFPISLLIIAFAYAIYAVESKNRIELLIEQNRSMIELQREAITQDFNHIISDALYLANEGELKDAFDGGGDPDALGQATSELQTFSRLKKIYDQIRFIDIAGMERIRVNFDGTTASIVSKEQLQSKRNRYYFTEAMKLKHGEVYISPLDLNIEQGEIEVPHKSMIRIASPVTGNSGQRLGVLVVNYLGEQMLDHFIRIHAEKPELAHLVNSDGFWLHSNPHGLEWGFMFEEKKDARFQRDHAQAWPEILSKDRGHIENEQGIYCFSSVHPLEKALAVFQPQHDSHKINWKIIAFNSVDGLNAMLADTRSTISMWTSLALLMALFLSWLLARAIVSSKRAEAFAHRAELRIHEAVRIALDAVITIDHEDKIIEINKSAEDIFGFSRDEMLGKQLSDTLIPPQFRDMHRQGMARFLEYGSGPMLGKRFEITAMHKDGHELPIELSITPIVTEEKPVFTAFIRDLTEKKQSEEKIHTLSQAIEQAGESIIITDLNGTIEYANPTFCSVTGYSYEEVVGKNPRILNSGQQNRSFYREMWKTIKKGETWQGRIVDKRKDGSSYPAILTISPIINDQREITHFIGLQQNLQEYEELEERFHQSQKMEALGTLVGGIAHDFNNTLAGITGNLFLIKKGVSEQPDILKKVETIESLSFRASDMIKQLMAFSRPTVTKMEQLYLSSFVKETIKLHEVSIPESVQLSYNISNESLYVQADVNQLQQMMINLVNNARDALEGTRKAAIRIALKRFIADGPFLERHPEAGSVEFAQITVSDNGPGITAEDIEHIFEPFFTTKEVGKGTGLGLSMVYGAVKSHKGIIEAGLNKPNGARFDIYIPLLKREEDEQQLTGEHAAMIVEGNGETILLVDDDESLINTVSEILEDLNYRVLTANNGEKAVETFLVHHHEIELLILDVVMPKMGGYDALPEMRKVHPAIKCIFTTGYDRMKVLQNQGVSDMETVLAKPYEVAELSYLIHEKLER